MSAVRCGAARRGLRGAALCPCRWRYGVQTVRCVVCTAAAAVQSVTVSSLLERRRAARRGSRWERGGPAVIGWSAAAASGEGETTQELNTGRRCSLTTLQDLPARLRFMNRYLRPLAADALAFLFLSISPKRAATKTDKLRYLRALPPSSSKTKRARTSAAWRCDINDVDRLAALNYVIRLRTHKDVACLSLAAFTLLFVSLFSLFSSYIIYFLVCLVCMHRLL